MKVFVSWSGEPSRYIAEAVHNWLPMIHGAVEPFMSRRDIGAGGRWLVEVGQQLEDTNFGIICLTKNNMKSPWINFEAGALAKFVEEGRVVPLLHGMSPSDVEPPLSHFQAKQLDREGIYEMIHELNKVIESPHTPERLPRVFDRLWPELEEMLVAPEIVNYSDGASEAKRSETDLIAELLSLTRSIELGLNSTLLRNPQPGSIGKSLLANSAPRIYVGALRLPDNVRSGLQEMFDSLPPERIVGWLYRDRELQLQLSNDRSLSDEEEAQLRSIAAANNIVVTSMFTDYD